MSNIKRFITLAAAAVVLTACGNNAKAEPAGEGLITIDDFAKLDLRLAKVLAAEPVEKSDKLLKLRLRVGESERTVVSGIAKHYTAEEMVGKTVVVVANLKPAKLRGIMSEGMILCAKDAEGKLGLVTVGGDFADGSRIG